MSTTGVSLILSITRMISALANQLCASTEPGSSANACSKSYSLTVGFKRRRMPPKNIVERVGMPGRPGGLRSDQLDADLARHLVL
jgi:hypothetical protein